MRGSTYGDIWYHGAGGSEYEPQREEIINELAPGRHLYLTNDLEAAKIYGGEVKAYSTENISNENVLDLGDGSWSNTPREWLEIFGLQEQAVPKTIWLGKVLEDDNDTKLSLWDAFSEDGDGREYNPEGEREFFDAVRVANPNLQAITWNEPYVSGKFSTQYQTLVVLDQGDLIPIEIPVEEEEMKTSKRLSNIIRVLGMQIAFGDDALDKSWQQEWELTEPCVHCGGTAHLAFVAYERLDEKGKAIPNKAYKTETDLIDVNEDPLLCSLREQKSKPGGMWFHDCTATAVYFCEDCLEPTAKYNQG